MSIKPEDAVVGMAIYESDLVEKIKDRIPSPSYLGNPTNRIILRAVYDLHETDHDITPVTVAETLEGEDLEKIGGSSTIAKRAENYSFLDPEGIESCLEEVVEDYIERETRREIESANEKIKEGANVISVIQSLNARLDELQSEKVSAEIHHVSDSYEELHGLLEQAKEHGALPGTLSTGFSDVDDRIQGIARNDLILISADTGVGKTSFALQIADTVADGQDKNVLIFSGEMHGWEVLMKILSKRGVATLDEMQNGELSDKQWKHIVNAENQLRENGLYTIRESQPTIYDFRSALRRADEEYGIDLAVLDYVQMLRNPKPQKLDGVEHLNLVSSELRDFTNEADIPVLAISRENKQGDIYGSSQLKYDCNYRIVIKDPQPDNEDKNNRVVSIEKARLAKGGKLKFSFQGENSRFIRVGGNSGGKTRQPKNSKNGRDRAPF
jgi:replicative DNA helicase